VICNGREERDLAFAFTFYSGWMVFSEVLEWQCQMKLPQDHCTKIFIKKQHKSYKKIVRETSDQNNSNGQQWM